MWSTVDVKREGKELCWEAAILASIGCAQPNPRPVRWGRSLVDLVVTLKELAELGVAFVSLTEVLDLITPMGRAMAGLLSVFAAFEHEILRERIRVGIAEARLHGKHLGRPVTIGKMAGSIRKLYRAGVSKAEIARRLEISRTSVRRLLSTREK